MTWCQTGDKQLSELIMALLSDAYVSLGLNELTSTIWYSPLDKLIPLFGY